MKTYAVLLSIALAVSAASSAQAAKHEKHHAVHHRMASAASASKTDWAGNPYMDLKQSQVDAFFRDAFNPWGAGAK